MRRASTLFVVGLACGAVLGFLASGGLPGKGMDADPGVGSTTDDDHAHAHDQIRLDDGPNPPSVSLALFSEATCTYNLHIQTTNFTFSPENVNGNHVPGEGHAHLYVDEIKLARLYGEWHHFTVPAGSKTITVTLNSNDHATLVVGDAPISAIIQLTDC